MFRGSEMRKGRFEIAVFLERDSHPKNKNKKISRKKRVKKIEKRPRSGVTSLKTKNSRRKKAKGRGEREIQETVGRKMVIG